MSDDKKPKKDLRARLGRTIAPNTPGAAPIAPPGGAPAPAPVAAPRAAAGGAAAAAAVPAPVAAPVVAPPIAAPAIGGPSMPFGGPQVAPPPFGQPAAAPQPAKPKAPTDPFAAGPSSAGPQEVRLVIDDKAVDEGEVGKRNRGRNFLLLGIGLVVGAALGGGFGSMNGRNILYNVTVRDGHEIYATVNTASQGVLGAQQKIDQLVERAAGSPTTRPGVDYEAVQALQGMEVPIAAGAFARKNYGAFNPGTVDDLFAYYNNVQILWERFDQLAARTLPEARRTELDRTAAMAADAATTLYGVIPQQSDNGVQGTLVVLDPPAEGATKLLARPRAGGQGRELDILTIETTIGTTPTHVFPIDNASSAGVLSAQLGGFRDYIQEIREIKTLMDQTVEIQGRLTTSLGEIARLEEVFAL